MVNILHVIRHEIASTLTKTSFWITTIVFPAIIVVLQIISQVAVRESLRSIDVGSLVGEAAGGGESAIGYVDGAGLITRLPAQIEVEGFQDSVLYVDVGVLHEYPDEASAQAALEAGDISQYYLIPADFMASGRLTLVDSQFSLFTSFNRSDIFTYVISFNLVDDAVLARALADPARSVESHRLSPVPPRAQPNNMAAILVPMVFFFAITFTSGFMLQSVTKEKENRTAEILLVSLRPRDLMLGKVTGLGIVALLQMAVWIGASALALDPGAGLLRGSGAAFQLTPGFLFWSLLYFVLGYLMYASALGALGALAPSAREGTQFTFLLILPLLAPIWLISAIMQSPNGDLATILSLFPLTAPTTMIIRLTMTDVPLWQLVVGLIGLALTAYGLVLLSARFFRADTLLSSASLSWRRIVRQLRD